jgi:hypothetical protein
MNRAGVHALILAGAGAAALAATFGLDTARQPEAPQVVTLPRTRTAPVAEPTQIPADRASLARELQRELRRVGCYDGEITGAWTTSTRLAMKAFNDRVNAQLPIDAPDPVLLTLLKAHREPACGVPCPPGEAAAADGRCLPSALAAHPEAHPEPAPLREDPPRQVLPAVAPAWQLPDAPTPQARRGRLAQPKLPEPASVEARPRGEPMSEPLSEPVAEAHPELDSKNPAAPALARAEGAGEPEPVAASTGRKPSRHHRYLRRLGAKPPKLLRVLVRNVARGLATLGAP